MSRRDPEPPRALAAFLEGEVTPSEAAAIEARVHGSESAQRHLRQLDEIRRTLARAPDDAEPSDAVAIAELWRVLDAPPPARHAPRPRVTRVALAIAACAALAAVLLVQGISSPPPAPDRVAATEFVAKAASQAPGDRWVRLEILRVDAGGVAVALPERGIVRAGDRLVFRYASGGPDPLGNLMVFAVDAARQIHWYYPAYEPAAGDPSSVSVASGGTVALPDAIEHQLAAGPLVFYGVFTRAPLRVLDVERRLEATWARHGWNPDAPPRIPIEASGQHIVTAISVP
jgi:hypothetical protein